MPFGQQSGRPASSGQLKALMALLEQAGYATFREARGPLGFTQRQGGGKFTVDEADAFIEQLQAEAEAAEAGGGVDEAEEVEPRPARSRPARSAASPRVVPPRTPSSAVANRARFTAIVKDVPPGILAAELERRGWILIPPEDYEPETGV